jgi:DNA-binding transcriptional ArsR family regulator
LTATRGRVAGRSTRSRRASDDAVFKALSDPTRRHILSLLRERRRSVGEIASNFHVSRPAISKHLRLLRDAGLVVDRPEGTARVCELNAEPLRTVDSWLEDYKTFWDCVPTAKRSFVE